MSATGKLNRAVTLAHCWPNQGGLKFPAIFPEGTDVHQVAGRWVISSVQLIAALTHNPHDAKHRYVWIDDEYVTPLNKGS